MDLTTIQSLPTYYFNTSPVTRRFQIEGLEETHTLRLIGIGRTQNSQNPNRA
jgi:hypothetical protein